MTNTIFRKCAFDIVMRAPEQIEINRGLTVADAKPKPASGIRKTLDSGSRAGIGNDARSDKPIPDKQYKHCADGGSDKARSLVSAIPANRLTKPGREEGACDAEDSGEYESPRRIRTRRKPARDQPGNKSDQNNP